MRHEELIGSGRLRHEQLDNAVAPSYRQENPDGAYGWNDVAVPATLTKLPASSAPAWVAWGNLEALSFAATGGEYAHFSLQLPHTLLPGSPINMHVHFTNYTATAWSVGQTAVWRITYRLGPANSGFTGERTVDMTYTAPNPVKSQNSHLITLSSNLGAGLNYAESTIITGRIERLSSDTYTDALGLLSIDAHMKIDSCGSSAEWGD